MNSMTVHVPDDTRKKIEAIAADRGVTVDDFISGVMQTVIEQHDAELRFREHAARGKHLKDKALELLRRPDRA